MEYEEDDERETYLDKERLRAKAELDAAYAKFHRKHRFDEWRLPFLISASLVVAYYMELSRTQWGIWFFGVCAITSFAMIMHRLKVMQFRLARMEDKLDQVAGNKPEDYLLNELNRDY